MSRTCTCPEHPHNPEEKPCVLSPAFRKRLLSMRTPRRLQKLWKAHVQGVGLHTASTCRLLRTIRDAAGLGSV